MGILWIIIIGFIAGLIARFLAPGPNKPVGILLTTPHCRDLHRSSRRLVSRGSGCGLDRRYAGGHRRAVCLESPCRKPHDQ